MKQLKTLNPQTLKDLIGNEPNEIIQFRIRFLQQAQDNLKALVTQFNHDQFDEIKENAHFLKTSAKAIGAEVTADLLQQLEICALNQQKKRCKFLIKSITDEIKLVYQECKL
ncbi:Hpt domain-containing protein [Pseudoalteromonas tunicata]|jgi:HPt (histidine-containing phosphotransfer) domain-containing protein|uniref:HPt domain-containing protein n=1 Tax=Pseudoalteromonas tunicata D2 TaxID=87626 RepID=A4CCE1_9GAMM|nr:Hpt domain-containing protein [Pseudoalteromonas tunicata]ATC93739.1 hypothetical protein PTUN_a1044 [Pseudoalteromonas tunicata]AXT29564.1 Hpt domain-containing protein [Pseudoalteromonas tunicata]EAR27234.1 hypothetical protein PTD2_14382 [Pseudoalteromonas tunicata D2]MDP4984487.1 Hpt domain-containing protein [Pseudoalteromonas tunicata]